jgi:hypothetical protein
MSAINKIKARRLDDLINEGFKTILTGSVGAVTDTILIAIPTNRAVIVTGFTLSTNNSSAVLASLGLKIGSGTTTNIFQAYLKDVSPITKTYSLGDWIYGDLSQSLVITTSAGTVAYSVDVRIIMSPTPLGYVEHDGAVGHSAPWFPPASGLDRGQG